MEANLLRTQDELKTDGVSTVGQYIIKMFVYILPEMRLNKLTRRIVKNKLFWHDSSFYNRTQNEMLKKKNKKKQKKKRCCSISYLVTRSATRMAYGPGYAKMCLMPYANNKGTDQPADQHLCCSLLR